MEEGRKSASGLGSEKREEMREVLRSERPGVSEKKEEARRASGPYSGGAGVRGSRDGRQIPEDGW